MAVTMISLPSIYHSYSYVVGLFSVSAPESELHTSRHSTPPFQRLRQDSG